MHAFRVIQLAVSRREGHGADDKKGSIISKLGEPRIDVKRKLNGEDTGGTRQTRRCLRETLIAKINELKLKDDRKMNARETYSDTVAPKHKRIRLQSDDAITRLINLGR